MSIPERNNLDLLRLALALMVLLAHAAELSTHPALASLAQWISASFAVEAFFVISGLLVTVSYQRSHNLWDYATKRLRRIYPAYALVITLTALTGLFWHGGWSDEAGRYLGWNLLFLNFLQPTLPGLFTTNPHPEINGALWTLKIEVMFYAALPALLWCTRFGRAWAWLLAMFIASTLYSLALQHMAQSQGGIYAELARQLPGQLRYFVLGMAAALYGLRLPWRYVLPAALLCAIMATWEPLSWLRPLYVAGVTLWFAFALPKQIHARWGDFSYGTYILHFPVIQAAVAAGWFAASPWAALASVLTITLGLAAILWHTVEAPILQQAR